MTFTIHLKDGGAHYYAARDLPGFVADPFIGDGGTTFYQYCADPRLDTLLNHVHVGRAEVETIEVLE